ncbi:unnamed protein product [Clonostachys rosea]|uniref:Ketoreductase (KR) domain-containing protein n=1 Tax=Bionectria ochroleuca TaxID=29856 RepID=A0ABY6UNG6_BIOOC|nr:unnamed protein product [Clonostachys rosea]
MSAKDFADRFTAKGCAILSAAGSFLKNEQFGSWAGTGALTCGAALAIYSLNKILSIRALNHGTRAIFDWSKEIVLVTGGSGGIGGETCNLMDYQQLQGVAAKIRREVGEPTVIVANAGICRGKPILKAEQKDIQVTFGVNTLGLLWTAKTFLPALASHNHGHFLVVASQTGYMATAGATDYCSSKAAAISIYEGLHSEMKHVHKASAVRISCISPSHVQTAMFDGIQSVPGMASLTPQYLAKTIEGILKSGRAQNLVVPASVGLSTLVRTLPDWIRVFLQDSAAGAFNNLKPRDDVAKSSEVNDEK